jgi:hypothetical protein
VHRISAKVVCIFAEIYHPIPRPLAKLNSAVCHILARISQFARAIKCGIFNLSEKTIVLFFLYPRCSGCQPVRL